MKSQIATSKRVRKFEVEISTSKLEQFVTNKLTIICQYIVNMRNEDEIINGKCFLWEGCFGNPLREKGLASSAEWDERGIETPNTEISIPKFRYRKIVSV